MQNELINILLAEDDEDDRLFFVNALKKIPIATHLTMVHDGDQLMNYLAENVDHLPDVLFLDLSMPRKTGYECLTEIKENKKLEDLVVIIFSTSFMRDAQYEQSLIKMLNGIGAYDYIRKPGDFEQLKQLIYKVVTITTEKRAGSK